MSKINLEEKITLKNLAGWDVGFSRKDGSVSGDITIPKNGTLRISRSEAIAQAQNDNKLINGTDGKGSHATVYIDDVATRVELDFESEDGKIKQQILTEEVVSSMFEFKTLATFEKKLKDAVVTRAEKFLIMDLIKKLKLNDYNKIRLVEEHTGRKL